MLLFRLPAAPLGAYKVYAVGGKSRATSLATFSFAPALSASSTYGSPDGTVILRGTSYGFREQLDVIWNCPSPDCSSTTVLAKPTTDASGSFSIAVHIPADADAGTTYAISAKGETSGVLAGLDYTVTP